ncbi:hypothetical protein AAFF_G00296750 [Aldrovandia affinis]|uniref:Uncharacterized protein n=1 Tax=Aldrovandia affinis TaxID=143900 RepID=A0AAD7SQ70_9TELE|nr:hypothetical protein AAFF_G00296750 [Aldrovandia affinis]
MSGRLVPTPGAADRGSGISYLDANLAGAGEAQAPEEQDTENLPPEVSRTQLLRAALAQRFEEVMSPIALKEEIHQWDSLALDAVLPQPAMLRQQVHATRTTNLNEALDSHLPCPGQLFLPSPVLASFLPLLLPVTIQQHVRDSGPSTSEPPEHSLPLEAACVAGRIQGSLGTKNKLCFGSMGAPF